VKIAVYSGTFDPITNGHLSILKRARHLFDKIYIAVAEETYKQTLFTVDERVDLVREATKDMPDVETESFSGLLMDYARKKGAVANIRGLRVVSDFEYEMQMASFNHHLNPDLETVFFTADGEFSMVSSSMIRNIASLNGDVRKFVPEGVQRELVKKYGPFNPVPETKGQSDR
jgi:pantetheine-phosphate adenylyltransferase